MGHPHAPTDFIQLADEPSITVDNRLKGLKNQSEREVK